MKPTVLTTKQTNAVYGTETKYECVKLFRTRSFSLTTIGLPLVFYVLFGIVMQPSFHDNGNFARSVVACYACFGMMGATLFGIGVGVAAERAMGWLDLKRTSPLPMAAYLFSKCAAVAIFSVLILLLLVATGVAFGGLSLTPVQFVAMLAMTVVGAVCLAPLGLLLALTVSASAAPGVVNMMYLPMAFLGGLWMPLSILPHWISKVAPALPSYHLSQLMLRIYGSGYTDKLPMEAHWSYLAVFAAVTAALACLRFRGVTK